MISDPSVAPFQRKAETLPILCLSPLYGKEGGFRPSALWNFG